MERMDAGSRRDPFCGDARWRWVLPWPPPRKRPSDAANSYQATAIRTLPIVNVITLLSATVVGFLSGSFWLFAVHVGGQKGWKKDALGACYRAIDLAEDLSRRHRSRFSLARCLRSPAISLS